MVLVWFNFVERYSFLVAQSALHHPLNSMVAQEHQNLTAAQGPADSENQFEHSRLGYGRACLGISWREVWTFVSELEVRPVIDTIWIM